MRFSARVQIDPGTDHATPTLLVEAEAPEKGMDDDQLLDFLKNAIPNAVEVALVGLTANNSDNDVRIEGAAKGKPFLHTRTEFGDQEQAFGVEEVAFVKARIIETMQNAENWHRKPAGKWEFGREFSLSEEDEIDLKPITRDEIEKIVTEGVSGIYKAIQDKIGVTTGDVAGLHHSGNGGNLKGEELEQKMVEYFVDYVRLEKEINRS